MLRSSVPKKKKCSEHIESRKVYIFSKKEKEKYTYSGIKNWLQLAATD